MSIAASFRALNNHRRNLLSQSARIGGPVIEGLEERRLFSVLAINGTTGNDTIVFNGNSFTLNGVTTPVNTATTTLVVINADDGADTITINKTLTDIPLSVFGGDGVNSYSLGAGKVDANLLGPINVVGNFDGLEPFLLDDHLNTADTNFGLNPGQLGPLSFSGIFNFTVNLGSGNDGFFVSRLSPGGKLTVHGNNGNEFFDCGGGDLANNILGVIHLDGGSGNDDIDLNDGNVSEGSTFQFKSNGFYSGSGAGTKLIDYVTCESVKLNCGEFNDNINASTSSLRVNLQLAGGNDTATGSPFADTIEGGNDNDTIHGGPGDDSLGDFNESGDDGNDTYFGEDGNDTINAVAGDDTLNGGPGNDKLIGGDDNDTYVFAGASVAQTDTITELAGHGTADKLDFTAMTTTVTVNLLSSTVSTQVNRTLKTPVAGQLADIENVSTGSGADSITGNNVANEIRAGAGADTVFGKGGADFIDGGAGNNKLNGDDGDDTIFGGANDDIIDGGNNNDEIEGREGNDTLLGSAGNDNLFPGTGNNILDGGEGNDLLFGSEGGNDTYRFGPASAAQTDTITEQFTGETDTLDFSTVMTPVKISLLSDTLATQTNRTVKTGSPGQFAFIENATGGSGADTITGNNANNVLKGSAGADTLTGNGGNDTLDGGEGSDILTGGTGDDTYKFAAATAAQTDKIAELAGGGTDTLDFSVLTTSVVVNLLSNTLATHLNRTVVTSVAGQFANFENVNTGGGIDKIFGNNAINILHGGGNNDEITGGGAADQLFGDDGSDKFFALDGIKDTINGGLGTDILGSADGIDVKVSVP